MFIYHADTNTYEEIPDPPPVMPALAALTPFRPVCLAPMPTLREMEREALIEALARTNGVVCTAAKLLGLTVRVIHYKINDHGLRAHTQAAIHLKAFSFVRNQVRLRKKGYGIG